MLKWSWIQCELYHSLSNLYFDAIKLSLMFYCLKIMLGNYVAKKVSCFRETMLMSKSELLVNNNSSRWMQICAKCIQHLLNFIQFLLLSFNLLDAGVQLRWRSCIYSLHSLCFAHLFRSRRLYLKRIRFTLMLQCKWVCKSFWFIFHRFQSKFFCFVHSSSPSLLGFVDVVTLNSYGQLNVVLVFFFAFI